MPQTDAKHYKSRVTRWQCTCAGYDQSIKNFQCLGPCLSVAVSNLSWVQPVAQQRLRVAQQLARKG